MFFFPLSTIDVHTSETMLFIAFCGKPSVLIADDFSGHTNTESEILICFSIVMDL